MLEAEEEGGRRSELGRGLRSCQLPVTVAWAMPGDDQECLEPVSFFWTWGWSRRGWMAFLFLFLPFICSRLERRVAVATTQRRAPHTCTTNTSREPASQRGLGLAVPGPFFCCGKHNNSSNNKSKGKRERQREEKGTGRRKRKRIHSQFTQWQFCSLTKGDGNTQDTQVVAQKPCPGSQWGLLRCDRKQGDSHPQPRATTCTSHGGRKS